MTIRPNSRSQHRGNGLIKLPHYGDRLTDDPDTFDALTELFLGDLAEALESQQGAAPGREAASKPSAAAGSAEGGSLRLVLQREGRESAERRTTIEVLMLGHLPALASIWGSQYLRDMARLSHEPIASLRMQGAFASVELFGESTGKASAGAGAERSDAASLEAAIETACARCRHWVIRADSAAEMSLIRQPAVDCVTLLTGADEAATIGAYRTIKQLSAVLDADDGKEGRDDEAGAVGTLAALKPKLRIRVVVMGADAEAARRVGEKLAETARECLKREIEYRWASSRIHASRPSVLLYNGQADTRVENLLEAITQAGKLSLDHAAPRAGAISEPAAVVRNSQNVGIAAAGSANRTPASRAGIEARAGAGATNEAAAVHSALRLAEANVGPARVEGAGEAVMLKSPLGEEAESEASSLAEHVNAWAKDSGGAERLVNLSLNCPYAPGVEFAVDEGGRMHVLAKFDSEVFDESSLGVLMIASQWASAHATLIGAAAPRLLSQQAPVLDLASKAIMHVFVREPRKVKRLLETSVRVHLLTAVSVRGIKTWVSTPLN